MVQLLRPRSGVAPASLTSHDNLGPAVIAGTVVCTIAPACFVAIRLRRSFNRKQFRWDDALITLAITLLTATTGVVIASVSYGEGRHVWDIAERGDFIHGLRLIIVAMVLSRLALSTSKVSVCVTLVQIGFGNTFNAILIFGTLVGSLGNVLVIIDLLAGCNTAWILHADMPSPNCLPGSMFTWTTIFRGATNVFQDVVDVVAPIWFLRYVNIKHRDRRAIQAMLCFLLMASVFAVVMAIVFPINLSHVQDMTWHSAHVWCLDPAETAVSIMATCLPAVRQVLANHEPTKVQRATFKNRMNRSQSQALPRLWKGRVQSYSAELGGLSPQSSPSTVARDRHTVDIHPSLRLPASSEWRNSDETVNTDMMASSGRRISEPDHQLALLLPPALPPARLRA